MSMLMNIGERLRNGRYEIVDLLAEGGQAIVAQAVDHSSGKTVVIRRLAASPDQPHYTSERRRFDRAGRIHIAHPNVPNPIDVFAESDSDHMVLPFIDGPELGLYLDRQGGRLPVDQAVRIVTRIASVLALAHGKGVVHRDLKPGNILIDAQGEPHLIDWGLASMHSEPTITQSNGFQGTLPFAAPEQIDDGRAQNFGIDLYALGVIFYQMLTGQQAAQGTSQEELARSVKTWTPPAPHTLDPGIGQHVSEACMRLLAKDPNDRFADAEELIHALRRSNGTGRRFCRWCGESSGSDGSYCPQCGGDLRSGLVSQPRCLACGSGVSDTKVCPVCRRQFAATGHQLEFRAGALAGAKFLIPQGIYEVGRDILNPRDQHISRRHLHVACLNGTVHVADAGSSNKTYVGDIAVDQPTPLRPGDELVLAGNRAVYSTA